MELNGKGKMLIGQTGLSIDSKGRFFLPVRFRKNGSHYILTRGLEQCLYLYPRNEWENILQKISTISWPDKTAERGFKRAWLSAAREVSLDKLGRLRLEADLQKYCQIKHRLIIIGVGKRLEIWAREIWDRYYHRVAEKSFRELARKLDI